MIYAGAIFYWFSTNKIKIMHKTAVIYIWKYNVRINTYRTCTVMAIQRAEKCFIFWLVINKYNKYVKRSIKQKKKNIETKREPGIERGSWRESEKEKKNHTSITPVCLCFAHFSQDKVQQYLHQIFYGRIVGLCFIYFAFLFVDSCISIFLFVYLCLSSSKMNDSCMQWSIVFFPTWLLIKTWNTDIFCHYFYLGI